MKKSIFIFRRDLRLIDNISFIECYKNSDKILPIFIFTPEQINPSKNKYFSSNGFQFMIESLEELNKELKKYGARLHYYYGDNVDILTKILKEFAYDTIYFNKDYTNYALKRDDEIKRFCDKENINMISLEDYLLNKIGTYLKEDGTDYQKFTPFKNHALSFPVPKPLSNIKYNSSKFIKITSSSIEIDIAKFKKKYLKKNETIAFHGGRENALKILKGIKIFKNYDKIRNILSHSTTHLSAYIKFGVVSIREVYHIFLKNFGKKHGLITQLYWREFYYYLIYYNQQILKGHSLKEQYNKIKWGNNKSYFKAWTLGKTGFPIVDAGMRELNETGFMHNRSRLITSNVLIKILNCDWKWGEKYFATKLIDYDPSVNNGNWQWSSGSGADSQPFFRIFSVKRQTENFDKDCEYIKRWVPELKDVPAKDIINWDIAYVKYKDVKYNRPIVDYEKMRKEILKVYKRGLYGK